MGNKFKLYQLVKVSADATGEGIERKGHISNIERFGGSMFVTVDYIGGGGITLTNTGMITPL